MFAIHALIFFERFAPFVSSARKVAGYTFSQTFGCPILNFTDDTTGQKFRVPMDFQISWASNTSKLLNSTTDYTQMLSIDSNTVPVVSLTIKDSSTPYSLANIDVTIRPSPINTTASRFMLYATCADKSSHEVR